MAKPIDNDDERARLEKELGNPIRPQVIRPHGFAVPDDREAIKRENELMEELHEKAVLTARREKLKLLLRRHSLAEGDYESLALALAIEHEPGFQVNRQIADLAIPTDVTAGEKEDPEPVLVRVEDGKQIDEPRRRPKAWTVLRLFHLFEAVEEETKESRLTKDLDALKRLARQKQWRPPPTHRSRSPRGEHDAWVRTLQSRLHDAKQLKRKVDRPFSALIDKA